MVPKLRNELWLVWKDTNTRERFVVGLLSFDSSGYHFRYHENEGKNNLDEAIKRGFELLPAFPDRLRQYDSEVLFHAFSNRLPSRKRKDVQQFFVKRGLPLECNEFEFLKETGARLPTDTLELVVPAIAQSEDEFEIEFPVAGLRYYDITNISEDAPLLPNTKLVLRLEPENKFDPHAIEVLTLDNIKLGYVPVFYSRYIDLSVKAKAYSALVKSYDFHTDYNEMLWIKVAGKSYLSEIIENLDPDVI